MHWLLISAAFAQSTAPLDELLAGLQATYGGIEAIEARFTQTSTSPAFGEGPTQQGTILLSQPRMMRLEMTGDTASTFISDGEQLYVYSPASKQVFITPDLADRSDGLSDLLGSLSALESRFEVDLLSRDESSWRIALTPRSGAQTLTLQIAAADYALERLEVTDAFQSTTQMRFTDINLAPDVPEGAFVFVPPEGVTVVRTDQI